MPARLAHVEATRLLLQQMLLRRDGGDDLFEAQVATQWNPTKVAALMNRSWGR